MHDYWKRKEIEDNILKSIYPNTWVRSTIVFFEAHTNYGYSSKTVDQHLKILIEKGVVEPLVKSRKNIWYFQHFDARFRLQMDEFIQPILDVLKQLSHEGEAMKGEILKFSDDFIRNASLQGEQKNKIKEITMQACAGRIAYMLLIEKAFELIRSVEPQFASKPFFIDSTELVPKEYLSN